MKKLRELRELWEQAKALYKIATYSQIVMPPLNVIEIYTKKDLAQALKTIASYDVHFQTWSRQYSDAAGMMPSRDDVVLSSEKCPTSYLVYEVALRLLFEVKGTSSTNRYDTKAALAKLTRTDKINRLL